MVLPESVDARDLDPEVRQDLRSLAQDTAELVARHLVATGRLIDDDPDRALAHARAAGALAGRVAVVREAVGLAAYAAQEYAEALSELRTARRISGRADHLAVLADCERGLGRPERALVLLGDTDVPRLDQASRVELVIVGAGARRDLGQADAAVLLLQGPARATTARRPWATRLWYAYADALLAADREDEARSWFVKAAEHDGRGETDAMERLLVLDGVVLQDLQDEDEDDGPDEEPPLVDLHALLAARSAVPVAPAGAGAPGDNGGQGDDASSAGDRLGPHESGAAPLLPRDEPQVVAEVTPVRVTAVVFTGSSPAGEEPLSAGPPDPAPLPGRSADD